MPGNLARLDAEFRLKPMLLRSADRAPTYRCRAARVGFGSNFVSARSEFAMAKVYGGRWQLVDKPELGRGGQGAVFRVTDRSGVLQGEFALKRVPDVNRRERFRREIEAIKRLTDPDTSSSASQYHFADRSLGPRRHRESRKAVSRHADRQRRRPDRRWPSKLVQGLHRRRVAGRQAGCRRAERRSCGQNHSSRCQAGEHPVYGQGP